LSSSSVIQSRELPKVSLNSSSTEGFVYQVPEDSFRHSQPDTALTFEARSDQGDVLPNWIRFDSGKMQLSGTKPEDGSQGIAVRIFARDPAGNQASTVVQIEFNN
jgi:hypothetical protein